MTTILIGSTNRFKQRKFHEMFSGMNIELITAGKGIPAIDVEEIGSTFSENATLKAVEWSRICEHYTISTDGGMSIPALKDDWDELRTGRFGGSHLSSLERAEKLLNMTTHLEGEDRKLIWREAVAVARDGNLLQSWSVTGDEGYLTRELHQQHHPDHSWDDWWVGSLWYFPRFEKTYAELSPAELAEVDTSWNTLGEHLRNFFKQK